MVKYNADSKIMNIYKNLQIVRSKLFTNMLLFVYIRTTSNIYWFISIKICCQRIVRVGVWLSILLNISVLRPLRRLHRNRKELYHQHHDGTSGGVQRRGGQRYEALRPLPPDDQTKGSNPGPTIMVSELRCLGFLRWERSYAKVWH
jgi:hypothetical protein